MPINRFGESVRIENPAKESIDADRAPTITEQLTDISSRIENYSERLSKLLAKIREAHEIPTNSIGKATTVCQQQLIDKIQNDLQLVNSYISEMEYLI